MKDLRKKLKQAPLLISVVFFVISLGAFVLLYKEVNKKNLSAEAVRTEAKNEAINKAQARSLVGFLENSASEIKELENNFAYRNDVVPLLRFLENLGPSVGVSSEVSSVEVTKEGTDLFVEIKIEGAFESVYKFLTLLENAPYKVEITALDIQSVSTEAGVLWQGRTRIKILSFIP